jgi:tRNA pseudouridine38-40 synthase
VVLNRREPSAVLRRFSHFEHRTIDLDSMRAAAKDVVGTHDFASFCGVPPDSGGTVRSVSALDIERHGDFVFLHARANGFLHHMVRIIVGTLLEIGTRRRAVDAIPAMLAANDRRAAGLTAPAQGLFLTGVRYDGFTSERPWLKNSGFVART